MKLCSRSVHYFLKYLCVTFNVLPLWASLFASIACTTLAWSFWALSMADLARQVQTELQKETLSESVQQTLWNTLEYFGMIRNYHISIYMIIFSGNLNQDRLQGIVLVWSKLGKVDLNWQNISQETGKKRRWPARLVWSNFSWSHVFGRRHDIRHYIILHIWPLFAAPNKTALLQFYTGRKKINRLLFHALPNHPLTNHQFNKDSDFAVQPSSHVKYRKVSKWNLGAIDFLDLSFDQYFISKENGHSLRKQKSFAKLSPAGLRSDFLSMEYLVVRFCKANTHANTKHVPPLL